MKTVKIIIKSLILLSVLVAIFAFALYKSVQYYPHWADKNGYIETSKIDYGKYIKDNNYYSNSEYIAYGEEMYQEGINAPSFNHYDNSVPDNYKEKVFIVANSSMGTYKRFDYTNYYLDDTAVYIALPNDGYYFKYWKITTGFNDVTIEYDSILKIPKYDTMAVSVKLEPIFSEEETIYAPIKLNVIDKKDDMPNVYVSLIDIEHFSLKGSIFIEHSEKYYIAGIEHFIKPTNGLGDIISDDGFLKTPHTFTQLYTSFIDENQIDNTEYIMYSVKFVEMKEKSVVDIYLLNELEGEVFASAKPVQTYVYDKGTLAHIISDRGSSGNDYLYGWYDSERKLLSRDKAIDIYADYEKINLYWKYKTADYTYRSEADDASYLFSLNSDDTLTLEMVNMCRSNCKNIVIPEYVEGKKVTKIANYAFRDHTYDITIPSFIEEIAPNAFKVSNWISDVTIEGDRDDLTFEMFNNVINLDLSNNTLYNLIQNEVKKFIDGVTLTVSYYDENDNNYKNGVRGYYTSGSRQINVFYKEENGLNRSDMSVIVHEIRHFYQEIAIDRVEGLSLDDLLVKPTPAQIGSWKYLEYTESTVDMNKYKYNAREIDSREYAYQITLYDLYGEYK